MPAPRALNGATSPRQRISQESYRNIPVSEAPDIEPTPIPEPDYAAMPVNDDLGEWPTHGGPLGCLVSLTFGCLLAAFFASPLIQSAYRPSQGYGGAFTAVALVIMVVGLIIFGIIGWRLGKRLYREYDPPTRGRKQKPTLEPS
jgi:hypothetical protein